MVGWADEFDEVAVGVFDDGEGDFGVGDSGGAFGEDFDARFFEALKGHLGAVDVNGEVAEAEGAGDVGLVAFFALIDGGLHELEGGGSFTFAEGEFFDDDFLTCGEAGVFGDFLAGGEFAGDGEADGFGVELE